MKKIIHLILLQILGFAFMASAQYSWSSVGTGMNFPVQSLAVDSTNNLLYAGGIFTQAGGVPAIDIAKWDGSVWSPLGGGVVSGSAISSLIMKDGELVAGGTFTNIGGILSNNIAKWDGLIWTPLGSGLDYTGATTVSTMCVFSSDLYAGGTFNNSGGSPVSFVAHWDGTNWLPLSTGTNGRVLSLCVYNGDLYAGGQFTDAGGVAVHNLAKWDGINWSDVGGGTNYTGATTVSTMKVYNNELYIGGTFDSVGGILPVANLAKWDGVSWSDPGGGANQYTGATTVSTMKVFNNELVVGGTLDTLGTGMNNSVLALESMADTLYAGGFFTVAGGNFTTFIAEWIPDVATSIIPAGGKEEFSVYPNPAADQVFLKMNNQNSGKNTYTFILYDLLGKEIIKLDNIKDQVNFNRGNIQTGLYIYKIIGNDHSVVQQGKISFR